MRDRVSCINYLIHNTQASKSKYQYSVDDVVSYNVEHIDDDMPIDNTYYVVEDMLKGLPRMELLKNMVEIFFIIIHRMCNSSKI